MRYVIEKTAPFDMLIHLGDIESSEEFLRKWVQNDKCVIYAVQGNNDFFSMLEKEKEIMIGKYRTLITHGHLYGVSLGAEYIKDEGKSRNFDIVMFGHTHKPYLEYCENMVVLNPGSLAYPRQDGRKPSYMIMEIDREGKAHFTVNYVEKEDAAAV